MARPDSTSAVRSRFAALGRVVARWNASTPGDRLAPAVLALLFLCLYLRLPRQGDIWWMDASRHALNGAFVLDFLKAMPFGHPVTFAYDYYRQWPALTILFYPPLFYASLALAFALFGVSESSALLAELIWFFILAYGAYRLSRRWLGPAGSLAVSLLLTAGPQLFYWGQQIMLDIPAYALIVWSAHFTLGYLENGKRRTLAVAVILAVLAVWTKYNAAYFLVVIAFSLLLARGPRLLRQRVIWEVAAIGAVFLIPVLGLFFKFGSYDLSQAYTGQGGGPGPLASFGYYATVLPDIVSWPVIVLALAYAGLVWRWPHYRISRDATILMIVWLAGTYLFYSTIAVKQPRHILTIGYPLVLAAVLVVERSLTRWRWRELGPLALAATMLGVTIYSVPIPFVSGVREAAQTVARLAPRDTNVAVWCRLDGTFIFNLRAAGTRGDMGVVRMDKLLFSDVAVQFEWGFRQRQLDASQFYGLLRDLHVQYVVFQSGYRDDVGVVHQLDQLLRGPKFREVATIPMHANYRFSPITVMHVYRLVEDVPHGRVSPRMQIKLLGIHI